MAQQPYVVALEEHFQDSELGALYGPLDANAAAHVRERLESFGGTRLKEMDEAGIDFQVISHSAPSVQKLDAETAIRMVPTIITRARVTPTAIEFMDKRSARASCEYLNERIPYEQAEAMLLIELDGNSRAQLEEEYEATGELCMQNGAIEVYVADNATTQERIWSVRRNIAESFMVVSPHQSLEDICVPVANIPKIIPELDRLSRKYDIQIPCYGHAGDGNLHVTPVKNPDHTLEQWHEMLPRILADLYQVTKELGGVISGEHGIGHKRKQYMRYSVSEVSLDFMKRVKKALDPNDILNPGKIFE